MDEQLTVSTPEQVAFHYEVAGIGSRFVASLWDHLIIFVTLFLLNCAAFALFPVFALGGAASGEGSLPYIAYALLVLIAFLVLWGYFVLFEIVWRGQTPGKRAGKLRVLRRSGEPIGAGEAIVRNLVRLVDFLPGFYGIGLISMFADKEARRLGDFAAGTIVVREGDPVRLKDVRVPEPEREHVYASAYAPYTNVGQNAQYKQPTTRYDPLPGISMRDITPSDYQLVRELLERVRRGEMLPERSRELALQLASSIAGRIGQNFGEWQDRGWEPVTFLQSIMTAKEARGE